MKKPARRTARARASVDARIVVVDETPLRDEVMREHDELEEQASFVRAKIERFETADLPAYTRWEARVLGPLLTAIREAESAISQKREILEAIEDVVFFQNCSRVAAYKRVMRARERGLEPEDEPAPEWGEAGPQNAPSQDDGFPLPPGFDVDDFDNLTPAQQRAFREEFAEMAEMYEAMTGLPAPKLDDFLRAARKGRREEARSAGGDAGRHQEQTPPPREAPPRETQAERPLARIKELYRLLVRKLHPDLNPDQPPRDRELWHTVQEAYNSRDLETLEAIAARVEIALNGQAGKLSISMLRRVVTDLRRSLSTLKTRFAQVRKHAAFDFAARNTASLAKYEEKHRKQLERNLRGLQTFLADLTSDLDRLAERAAKPNAKKQRAVPDYYWND